MLWGDTGCVSGLCIGDPVASCSLVSFLYFEQTFSLGLNTPPDLYDSRKNTELVFPFLLSFDPDNKVRLNRTP